MKTFALSKKNIALLLLALIGGALLLTAVPHADVFAQGSSNSLINPGDKPTAVVSSDFRTAVVGFLNYFLGFLGLIAVAFVVYAGVLMVTSQGEDDSTGKAKKILLYAGIGIVIILLSFAIVNLIVGAGDSVA